MLTPVTDACMWYMGRWPAMPPLHFITWTALHSMLRAKLFMLSRLLILMLNSVAYFHSTVAALHSNGVAHSHLLLLLIHSWPLWYIGTAYHGEFLYIIFLVLHNFPAWSSVQNKFSYCQTGKWYEKLQSETGCHCQFVLLNEVDQLFPVKVNFHERIS